MKSKLVAGLLAFFLGTFGIHRFYLGKTGTGILMLILMLLGIFLGPFLLYIPSIIVGMWVFIDLIRILVGNLGEYES